MKNTEYIVMCKNFDVLRVKVEMEFKLSKM